MRHEYSRDSPVGVWVFGGILILFVALFAWACADNGGPARKDVHAIRFPDATRVQVHDWESGGNWWADSVYIAVPDVDPLHQVAGPHLWLWAPDSDDPRPTEAGWQLVAKGWFGDGCGVHIDRVSQNPSGDWGLSAAQTAAVASGTSVAVVVHLRCPYPEPQTY